MVAYKLFSLAFLIIGCQSRYVIQEIEDPQLGIFEIPEYEIEDSRILHPSNFGGIRVRRQTHGVVNTNPDGAVNIMTKTPLVGNGENVLSAIGGANGLQPGGKYGAVTGGLSLDNVNGHGLSVAGKHIPGFGNQLTGAGHLNLLNDGVNKVDANAFITKNLPTIPNVPNFNTRGVGLDYMYKDKIGASLGAAQTDLFKRTDYSAMGNLNLFKNPSSSLDLSAGFTKSVSPFIPNRSWQPSAGLSFSKYF